MGSGKQENLLDKRAVLTGSIVAALVVSVAVFSVMIYLEKQVLTKYEKGKIYVAVREIPKGQLIDKENAANYLTARELDASVIPETAIKDVEQIEQLIAVGKIEEGVLLTEGMFQKREEILAQMEEPVIAGFKADDLYQVVGGVLRTGDRIHIYNENEEGIVSLKWDDIYVQQVFDSSGNAIENADADTSAQRINIYLAKEDVDSFYTELETGMLRVVKVCD